MRRIKNQKRHPRGAALWRFLLGRLGSKQLLGSSEEIHDALFRMLDIRLIEDKRRAGTGRLIAPVRAQHLLVVPAADAQMHLIETATIQSLHRRFHPKHWRRRPFL